MLARLEAFAGKGERLGAYEAERKRGLGSFARSGCRSELRRYTRDQHNEDGN